MAHPPRAPRLAVLPATLLALAACSTTPALTLTATPSSIGGDGQSPVTLTAKVTAGGAAAPDGTIVHFTATDGILGTPDGTHSETPLVFDLGSTSGAAIAILTVPKRGRGSITVNASSSFNGANVSQQSTITLTPHGGLASSLSFTCASQNVGGLITGLSDPIHVLCTATAYDANNHPIVNASIEPYAEAGELSWYTDTSSNPVTQQLIYTINPGANRPVDVDPLGPDDKPRPICPANCVTNPDNCDAEPCWVDNGVTHNPRDGVATLMVAVPGVPGFFDQNSYGEPFVDSFDLLDGQNGPAYQQGEFFIDVNGNGQYDSASASNGAMQSSRMLWKSFRIIWSGSADVSTSTHASTILGSVAGTTLNNLVVRLNDRNYNKLATNSSSDSFSLQGSCTPDGSLSGNAFNMQTALDPGNPGILFRSDTGGISSPGSPSTYRQETDTNLQQLDGPTTITGNTGPSTCSVSASVTRTYDPGAGTTFPSNGQASGEQITAPFSFGAPPDAGP